MREDQGQRGEATRDLLHRLGRQAQPVELFVAGVEDERAAPGGQTLVRRHHPLVERVEALDERVHLEAEEAVLAQAPVDDRALVGVGHVQAAERDDPRMALVQLEVEAVHRRGLVAPDRVHEVEHVVDRQRVVVGDALLERHVDRDRVLGIEAVHPLHETGQPAWRQQVDVAVDEHGLRSSSSRRSR